MFKDYWACKAAFDAAVTAGLKVTLHYLDGGKMKTCLGLPLKWDTLVALRRDLDGRTWNLQATRILDVVALPS